jgi:hypothetical protein
MGMSTDVNNARRDGRDMPNNGGAEQVRCTEWRLCDAAWQFDSHGGAAIGALIVRLLHTS